MNQKAIGYLVQLGGVVSLIVGLLSIGRWQAVAIVAGGLALVLGNFVRKREVK